MAILDKLMFWKKEAPLPAISRGGDLGLDTGMQKPGAGFGGEGNLGLGGGNLGLPPTTEPGFGHDAPFGTRPAPQGFPPSQPMQQQTAPPGFQAAPPIPITPQQPAQQEFTMVSKDIELLSYKLDTLKAAIDVVNHRLAHIEKLAEGETAKRRSW